MNKWMAKYGEKMQLNRTLGQRDSGMYAREHAEHFWPQYSNDDRMVAVTTVSTSADG